MIAIKSILLFIILSTTATNSVFDQQRAISTPVEVSKAISVDSWRVRRSLVTSAQPVLHEYVDAWRLHPVQRVTQRPSAPKKAIKISQSSYNIFRSVVIPVGKLAAFKQWPQIAPREQKHRLVCADSLCNTPIGTHLAEAAKKASTLGQYAALQLVNRAVNKSIRYRSDRGDQWASLSQTAARGFGDCEDYAIAKMELLSRIGFTNEQLQFVVLKDTNRQRYHAVLMVHVGGKKYVLDNLSNVAASDSAFHSYMPIASFVGGKSFIHGFSKKTTRTASLGKGGFAAVRLGSAS